MGATICFGAAALVLLVLLLNVQSKYLNQSRQIKKLTEELAEYRDKGKQDQILLFSDEKGIQELLVQVNLFLEQQAELDQKQRQYEVENRKLLANISHDLKTPLTVIYGYSEMLLSNRELPTDIYSKVDKIHNKTQDVLDMINEFFDLVKLESGDMKLKCQCLDVCELCRNEIINYYDTLNQKGFHTEVAIPEESIYIQGDERALQRILNNLLQNALKYGADGKYLKLCLKENRGSVQIEVIDRGKGIVEEHQDQVFERLVTLEDARNKKYHGSGLGLTITKRLTEAMGGRICLKSSPYVSTTFTVEFPRFREDNKCKIPNRNM
jgi:signal transduction histidine kinase